MSTITQTPCMPSSRLTYLACGAFIAMLVLGIAAPRSLSFLPGVWGLIVFSCLYFKTRQPFCFDKNLLKFAGALLLLGACSAVWSMDVAFALEKVLKTALVFFAGFVFLTALQNARLPENKADILSLVLVILCGVAALVIYSEYETDFMLSRILLNVGNEEYADIEGGFLLNRSIVFLVLLSMPFCMALYLSGNKPRAKQATFAFFVVAIALALWQTRSQTAQLTALVIVLMAFYPTHKRLARRILAGCILLTLWLLPFSIPAAQEGYARLAPSLSETSIISAASVPHRFEVWSFISRKIHQSPIIGHGIEATRFLKSREKMELMNSYTVLHPHNFFLQIWVEFGMIGAALFSAFFVFLFARMEKLCPLKQRYYAALMVSLLCILSFGYGMWQGWQIGMIFALAAMSAMAFKTYPPKLSA